MNGLSPDQYRELSLQARLAYLQSHVSEGNKTDLDEDFLLAAIAAENAPMAQWFLVKAIGLLGLSAGISPIVQLCKGPEAEMRHTSLHSICAWSLGRIGPTAYDLVAKLLESSNIETRRCAVDALGEIGDPRAVELLCSALEHDDHKIQIWAGLSLAKLGNVSMPCLQNLARNSPASTRAIAADAIEKISKKQLTCH